MTEGQWTVPCANCGVQIVAGATKWEHAEAIDLTPCSDPRPEPVFPKGWTVTHIPPRPAVTAAVGRLVHYVARGSVDGRFPATCRMAFITEAGDLPDPATVGLVVVNPSGFFFHPREMGGVEHYAGALPLDMAVPVGAHCDGGERLYLAGTWHMPEHAL